MFDLPQVRVVVRPHNDEHEKWLAAEAAFMSPAEDSMERALSDRLKNEEPCRIYAPDLMTFCLVDPIDYPWAAEYAWCLKTCRYNLSYFRRAVSVNENGVRVRTISLYLHVEIMKRTGIEPPAPDWNRVDHRDGNTLNNRRSNLRWSTYRHNALNKKGRHPQDF